MRLDIHRVLLGLLSLVLGLGSLVFLAPGAQAGPGLSPPNHLVISEVNGDQAGVYRTNWVELYNPTDSAISLGTLDTSTAPATVNPKYFLCYASQAGTTCTSPYRLYGTILAHHYFLVELYDAGGSLPALPAGVPPDLNFASMDATVNPSQQAAKNIGGYSTGGQVLLLDASVDAGGAYPTKANYPSSAYSFTNRNLADASINPAPVVDAMGFTPPSTASSLAGSEGWTSTTDPHPAPVQDASHWDERTFVDGIPQDTNDNAADFRISQRDPISQTSSRVAVAPVSDALASSGQAMSPITVTGSKGVGTLSCAATGLPEGVSIDSGTGVISGTPAAADPTGAYSVTVTVSDSTPGAPDTASTSFTLTLSGELRVDPIANVSVSKGSALSPIQVQTHGGVPPYRYAATGLPTGLSIDSTGSISGTPTGAVGSYAVHVSVTDSGTGGTAQQTLSTDFTLTELPSLTGPASGDPLGGLRINEVRATGTAANDWVELYNTGGNVTGASVDLADSSGALFHITGLAIAAGGYAVLNGADLDAAGLDLTAGDTLYLSEAGDDTLLDRTTWTLFEPTSWARTTDGGGTFAISAYATKGAANSGAPVIKPNDLLVSEVNYDNNSTDYYEYSEVTNTTDHPIDFAAYGLTLTKSGTVMTLHDPSDTTSTSPTFDPVIPAHGTQLFWWVETQYYGVKTTAQFLSNYSLAASTPVVLVFGFSSMANSGGDHSYYLSVNQGATPISQAWVDTPCAANTFNGASVCTATNGNYAEHYEVPADRTSAVAAVWYNSLHSGGDDINFVKKAPLSTPNTVDLEQVGFTRAVKISSATSDAITLHNTSSTAIDLSGYVLQKNSAGASYTLPPGSTVAAGADLVVHPGLTFGDSDYAMLLAPQGYAYSDGVGLADTTGPFLHTLSYDASSGQPPVIDPTTGLPLPPAGGLYRPAGVSAQGGTVYASNTGDNVVAALTNGANTIVAGSLEGYGDTGDEGPAAQAYLYQPGGTAEDANGNVFLADSGNNVIRKITPDGKIHRFAGTGNAGGAAEAVTPTSTPTTVNLWHPQSVAVDSSGNVFIADTFDNRILKVTAAGAISVVAGTGKASYSGDGAPATSATLSQPSGVAVDALGDVYIADSSNNVIRRVDAGIGIITTVAGNYAADQAAHDCLGGFAGDGGAATSAQLNDPQGVALDGAGDLFIADTFNNAVREVTPDGTITTLVNTSTIAGSESTSPTGSGALPASTHLNTPSAVAIDRSTNVLYLADTRNNAIASVSNAGHSGNASGPVESAAALAASSSTTATNACAVLANGSVVSTSAPTISGTPVVGSTLTANPGSWTPTPDSFSYQWLRDGTPVAGATGAMYKPTSADAGHQLSVTVTASKAGYGSASATSAAVSVTASSKPLTTVRPTISGTFRVGGTVTANAGAWKAGSVPLPAADLSYQWLRNGRTIAGATKSTYTVVAADAGTQLSVAVTGRYPGYTTASSTSSSHPVAAGLLTTAAPTIGGIVRVGHKIIARPGSWKAGSAPLPASDFSYQWLRNGRSIAGATSAAYMLVPADYGTKVSLTVTGKYPGYATASRTSSGYQVAAGTLATAAPTIVGTAKVGSTLTAKPGGWLAGTVALTGSHLSYQWYANGQRIPGATRSTYKVTSSELGRNLTVHVTGRYTGYTPASRTSKATAAVTK